MTIKKPIGLAAAAVTALAMMASTPAYAGLPTERPTPGSCPTCTATATAPLTDAEKTGLIFSREEERLAKELYEAFAEKWGVRAFSNIASSEVRHFDAMGRALDRYGVADPSAGSSVGVYADPALQAKWDDWYARGMQSQQAAFDVGVELEKLDIADLQKMMEGTDKADLDRVYGNLLQGSENHLRAYESLAAGKTTGMGPGQGRGQGQMQGQRGQGQMQGPRGQGQRGQCQQSGDCQGQMQGQRGQGPGQKGQGQGRMGQGQMGKGQGQCR